MMKPVFNGYLPYPNAKSQLIVPDKLANAVKAAS